MLNINLNGEFIRIPANIAQSTASSVFTVLPFVRNSFRIILVHKCVVIRVSDHLKERKLTYLQATLANFIRRNYGQSVAVGR